MLSYAGVSLTVPTPEQQESIQAWLDTWSDVEFSGKNWPGKDLTGTTFIPTLPQPQPRLGSLYWPYGASRWAVGHFVCSDYELNLIRLALNPGTNSQDGGDGFINSPIPGILRMETSPYIEPFAASLYMLPPRPIHQIAGSNGLNLLTLVDQRYYWWYVDSDEQPISSATQWTTIYGNLSDQLEVTINADPVSANYYFPAPEFTNYFQALPIMLDAVAFNCGQRIVCDLSGRVSARNCVTDVATLTANITALNRYGAKILGGSFDRADDFEAVLPASVANVTRDWKNSVPTSLAPLYHSESVDLLNQNGFNSTTGFYNFTNIRGFAGVKTFNDVFHGSETSAYANEAALAGQIALDYWSRIANAFLDVTVAHPFNVLPEGLHDIEWSYTRERVSTRIYKSLWNWEPDTFLHGDGNGPFSGNSQYAPWQVEPFFAQVSSPTGTAYPWTEVIPATGGTWTTKPSGRSGTDSLDPAYEFNASTSVTPGSIVQMWRGFQNPSSTKQEWLFAVATGGGGGGSLTVQESDGSPICTGVTTLIADSNSLAVVCGGGTATLSALGTNAVYVLYEDHALKQIPCNGLAPVNPPYSPTQISAMQQLPGLDFTNALHSIPVTTGGGGGGSTGTCSPGGTPPVGYYCHQNPGGNTCSMDPTPAMGDTAVTGPYPDNATCMAACTSGPPAGNTMFSLTPGVTWNVIKSIGTGDTGPCTNQLTATVTYPPPNLNQLVNGYIPGYGTSYPLNLKDSCTITWLVNVDPTCNLINLTSNWNGLSVYGATSCPFPDCSGTEDLLGQCNGVVFSKCDFMVTDVGASCAPLRLVKINTCGLSKTASFSFLDGACVSHTFEMVVLDGLVRQIKIDGMAI